MQKERFDVNVTLFVRWHHRTHKAI